MSRAALDGLAVPGLVSEVHWVGPEPAAAPTMVLVPEAGGRLADWGDWPEALSRATGLGVAAFTPGVAADAALPALLDRAGVERAILVGAGSGAVAAARYAGGRQDRRIRALALIGPAFPEEALASDLLDAIGHIRVPILVIIGAGADDRTRAGVDLLVDEAYCPADVAVVPGADVAPHRERPAETLERVRELASTLFDVFEERAGHGH